MKFYWKLIKLSFHCLFTFHRKSTIEFMTPGMEDSTIHGCYECQTGFDKFENEFKITGLCTPDFKIEKQE